MKCAHPHTMRRDGQNLTVPCRKCMPCRIQHAMDWSFRIESELKYSKTAHFITLTYSEENIPRNDSGNGILVKSELQKFFKRLRFNVRYSEDRYMLDNGIEHDRFVRFPSIKYYAVGEYGEESFRPHYHAIIFNIPTETLRIINKIWNKGHIKVGTVTPASIKYVTKYITKVDSRDIDLMDLTPPFNLISKGLGSSYVNPETTEYHSHIRTMSHVIKKTPKKIPNYYIPKLHDLEDPLVKRKLKYSKAKSAAKAKHFYDKQDQELRAKGINPILHDINKQDEFERKVKSKKRNKL